MIRILFGWLLQFFMLAGLGLLTQQVMWRQAKYGAFRSAWFGWAVLLALLQLWHFFWPINGACFLVMLGLSMFGWPLLLRRLSQRCNELELAEHGSWDLRWCLGLVLFIGVLVAAHIAVPNMTAPDDTQLYHLNVVRWNNEYPVVPGLANLHSRFGLNTDFLLYASLWDTGWADRRSAWLVSGLALMLVIAQWASVLMLRRGAAQLPERLYCMLTLPYLVFLIERSTATLYYDKAPLLALLVLGLWFIESRWFRRQPAVADEALAWRVDWRADAAWCLAVASFSFVCKPSGAMALALTFFGMLVAWLVQANRQRLSYSALGSDLVRAMAWPTLLVVGFFVTNVLLSGWVLFPAPVLRLPVAWAYPEADTKMLLQVIGDWAKLPGPEGAARVHRGLSAWLPEWEKGFVRSTEHFLLPLGVAAALIGSWLMRQPAGKPVPWSGWAVSFFVIFGLGNIAFWFVTAPDLRFGDGLFYLWLGLAGTLLLSTAYRRPTRALPWAMAVATLTLYSLRANVWPTRACTLWLVGRADSQLIKQEQLGSGPDATPTIYVPVDAEAGLGDCPLPSAPKLDPRLRWREPGNLRAGFYMEAKTAE